MKYQGKITEIVPDEIRVKVFKKAIDIIKRKKPKFGLNALQLCFILPCILFDQKSYLEGDWYSFDTRKMFPEITDDNVTLIENSKEPNKVRIELLTQWIEQLTK